MSTLHAPRSPTNTRTHCPCLPQNKQTGRSLRMIRPPVAINRRRGRSDPPPAGSTTAAAAAAAAASTRGKQAPASARGGSRRGGGGGGVACDAAMGQVQLRLEGLRGQMAEWAAGPMVTEAVARRAGLQEKREQFLSLLQQLLSAREETATQNVWLCSEREREVEARGLVLETRVRAVQHQRRIKELLLRTDPKLALADLKAGLAQLGRDAHVATVQAVHEAAGRQKDGYASLARDYPQALRTEARVRGKDIQWAATLLPKLLDGVGGLMRRSEALKAQVLGRFLRRRHQTQQQRQLLAATKSACVPLRLKWEEESEALEMRFKGELAALRGEAAAARETRMARLRDLVAGEEAELRELDGWYNQLLDAYEDRCKELEELARHARWEAEEWGGMRAEARVFYETALQEVRMRLRAWHMQREREEELLGAQGLWEAVEGMRALGFGGADEEEWEEGSEGETTD